MSPVVASTMGNARSLRFSARAFALALVLSGATNAHAADDGKIEAMPPPEVIVANETMVDVQRRDLSNTVPAGQPISIDNPYGDVRLRFGGYEHAVDIHATFQQPAGAALIMLEPRSENGRHLIAPRLPPGVVLAAGQRIDLVVYVPEKHGVSVRTERGLIEGRGLKSDLELRSVDGDIILRGTDGAVQAETAAGAIEAALLPSKPGWSQRLATSTGNILIGASDKLDANLLMSTSGVFATEFSLVVSRRPGEEPNKQARTTIGDGNSELLVESRRGEIKLLRRAEYNEVPEEAPSKPSDSGESR